MKKSIVILLLVISCPTLFSQTWQEKITDPANFYSIREAYLNNSKIEKEKNKTNFKDSDGEEEKFRRWEYIMEPRVYPSGKMPITGYLLDELNKFNETNKTQSDTIYQANWKPIESSDGFPDNGYSGRMNCIAFHPLDTNIIYLGSPCGGLWKTTNGGSTWVSKTDYFPSLGVSEIVFNPKNPDIMYMATGDKDAAYFISNPYSYGLLKSTDGGESWDTTGLKHLFKDQMTIQRLIIHPTQPNILLAAVTGENGSLKGIWRTTDGGTNWKNVIGGAKYDIEFNPANPNIVYASAYKYLTRSTDAGATWINIVSDSLPKNEVTYAKIAVSPANPHIVFAQFLNPNTGYTYGLYKSSDDAISWRKINSQEISIQSGYDWVLTMSELDSNLIFYGGQELFGSYDGGKSTVYFPSGHVDHHGLDYRPGTNVLYNCNDGGIYKSYNNAKNWQNLNKTLQTFQYYRLGGSLTNKDLIITGAQDNGTQKHTIPSWLQIGQLADGAECIVDYNDPKIFYTSYQYGWLNRFGMVAGAFTMPPTAGESSSCAWITPYLMHPTNSKVLFFGAKDVFKTTDRGNEWMGYSDQLTAKDNVGGGMLRCMAISESMPDSVLYAGSYVVVYMTSDGGKKWNNITTNLPTSAGCFDCSAISSIAVHPQLPMTAWVAMSGYKEGNKVFKTTNGGNTWVNISGNLPNIPVNNVIYEKNNKDGLYLGTDLGVFYKDSSMTNWVHYMKGLPNVPVQELEIHYPSNRLRAATFGRGLWETNLYGVFTSVDEGESTQNSIKTRIVNGILELPESFILNSQITIYSSIGAVVYSGNSQSRIDVSYLPSGIYFVKSNIGILKFIKN
jgi:photosystem II stability/assembly factor-like uncharacterized protein